jgi:hypothetical protein
MRDHGDAVQLDPQRRRANYEHEQLFGCERAALQRGSLIERRAEVGPATAISSFGAASTIASPARTAPTPQRAGLGLLLSV